VFDAGNRDAVEHALAGAKHKVSVTYPINRITAVTMEPRTALGQYDPVAESYTLHCGLQNPHAVRESLANDIFRVSGNRVRVISPDVGGGFGLKEAPFPEYVLTLLGARLTGRQLFDHDARSRRKGPLSRAEGRDHRQYRRLYLAYGPACLDQQSRRACRRLSYAAHPFARDRCVHEHAADRALSRRRTA
jgi:carbon-monoxide dehydrogenase large subunit